ncbi:MAG: 3-deoxy-7-phosphoheptulonate synthase, partial [Erysipelotrichaceae bacterium]
ARNMQNYSLLQAIGKTNKPVLLKRGMACTIEELLSSAEYIISCGNPNVILCERGIRTFENYTRNTLDISAISILKEITHLPVIVDPSHATGIDELVLPMTLSSIMAGCDGFEIEVHRQPCCALSDNNQQIDFKQYETLMGKVNKLLEYLKSE